MQSEKLSKLTQGIFSSLTSEELDALTSCMDVEKIPAGEYLRGQRGFCVLLEGDVSVLRETVEIGELRPGDGFVDCFLL